MSIKTAHALYRDNGPLKASINLENENKDTEINEQKKEEWMFMSELNLQELGTSTEYNSVLAPEGYWHNVSEHFEDVDLHSVTSWLNTQKKKKINQAGRYHQEL